MECILCREYFAPSTCDACWWAYWLRVARNFREDSSRPWLSLARNLFAIRLRVCVCTRKLTTITYYYYAPPFFFVCVCVCVRLLPATLLNFQ